MERDEDSVRVWVGLNLLQAQLLEEVLREHGIECFSGQETGLFLAGGRLEISLWVPEHEEKRARALLERAEEEMSEALDAEGDAPQADT